MIELPWIKRASKAELHLHLEGSIPLEILRSAANRKGLPSVPRNFYAFRDFHEFDTIFSRLPGLLYEEEDFYLIGLALASRQAADGVAYTETFTMPVAWEKAGIPLKAVLGGVDAGLKEGERIHGVCVRLIYSIPRLWGEGPGLRTLEIIREFPLDRVVGVDLTGPEHPGTVAPFRRIFRQARSMGLQTVAHAGEFSSPKQVWETLRLLKPRRIGHGICSAEDESLMEHLAREDVPLEISLGSNVLLGAVPALEDHPVRNLFEHGVPIVINTDDPAFFGVSLTGELSRLVTNLGFVREEVEGLMENGFRYAFSKNAQGFCAPRTC